MKTFIRKSLTYIVILLLLTGGIISVLLRLYPEVFLSGRVEYVMWNKQLKRIHSVKNQPHLNAIIGDSRAMAAINPRELSPNFQNFSLGGTSFYEGYITLRTLLKTNKIDTLILCYAPVHFEKNGGNLLKRTMVFQHPEINDIQHLNEIEKKLNANIETDVTSDDQPSASFDRMMHYHHEPFIFRGIVVDQFRRNWNPSPVEDQVKKELDQNLGHAFFGRNTSMFGVAEEAREKSFEVNPVIDYYLNELMELVKKHHIACYIITPPTSKNTYKFAKKGYFRAYLGHLLRLQSRYPFAHVDTTLHVYGPFQFGDASHVNALGGRKFGVEISKSL